MRSACGVVLALLLAAGLAHATGPEVSPVPFSETILVTARPIHLVPIPPGKAFEIAFKVGELDIEARPVFEARLEIDATCREVSAAFCAQRLERLRLRTRELDDRVRVELVGMSRREMNKLGVEATIVVPERAPLIVKMGIGDLEIDAGPQSLEVGMSIGALAVRAPAESIGSLDTGERHESGKRRMLLGARLRWDEGEGESRIAVKLGIGDAQVRLE